MGDHGAVRLRRSEPAEHRARNRVFNSHAKSGWILDRARNDGDGFSQGFLPEVRYVPEQLAATGDGHVPEFTNPSREGRRRWRTRWRAGVECVRTKLQAPS